MSESTLPVRIFAPIVRSGGPHPGFHLSQPRRIDELATKERGHDAPGRAISDFEGWYEDGRGARFVMPLR